MSYNNLSCFLLLGIAGLLTACAPGKPITTTSSDPGTIDAALLGYDPDMSLLAVGRAVSDNAVDLYDPNVTVFHVLPPSRSVVPTPDSIPLNHMIISRNKSVRVYALNTVPIPDVPTAEPLALADPIPLKDE